MGAYFQNAHIPTCKGTVFSQDPNCGSTIEIHYQGKSEPVLSDVKLDVNEFPSGFQIAYISTAGLCVGVYELWFVVRTRTAPYVEAIRSFTVSSPSCAPVENARRKRELEEEPADKRLMREQVEQRYREIKAEGGIQGSPEEEDRIDRERAKRGWGPLAEEKAKALEEKLDRLKREMPTVGENGHVIDSDEELDEMDEEFQVSTEELDVTDIKEAEEEGRD